CVHSLGRSVNYDHQAFIFRHVTTSFLTAAVPPHLCTLSLHDALPIFLSASRTTPSLTSNIAVAPALLATIPAANGGSGTKCRSTNLRMCAGIASSFSCAVSNTAYPAADHPQFPANATTTPARAPERTTARAPS